MEYTCPRVLYIPPVIVSTATATLYADDVDGNVVLASHYVGLFPGFYSMSNPLTTAPGNLWLQIYLDRSTFSWNGVLGDLASVSLSVIIPGIFPTLTLVDVVFNKVVTAPSTYTIWFRISLLGTIYWPTPDSELHFELVS